MPDQASKEEQGRRLKRSRVHAGHATAVDAWHALSKFERDPPSTTTYLQHENGTRSLKNEAQTYAKFYAVPVEWLVYGNNAPDWAAGSDDMRGAPNESLRLGVLPLRGIVQAGAWFEIDAFDQSATEEIAGTVDPRFPPSAQWISRVVGDSMNALVKGGRPSPILEGDYVQCVDVDAIDYRLKDEDVVEVERLRLDGREREVTLKQIAVMPGGEILLWPRSTNPRWKDPIPYADQNGVEVRVRGLVLGATRRFE